MKMLIPPAIESLHTIHLYDSQKRRDAPVACVVTGYDGEQVVVRYRDMKTRSGAFPSPSGRG